MGRLSGCRPDADLGYTVGIDGGKPGLARLSLRDLTSAFRSSFARGAIGSNSLLSFVSLTAQFFSNVVLVIILARLVDVSTLGEILYATVFANIIVVLASYGFDNLVVREISQDRYGIVEITSNLLIAKLVLTAALALLVGVLIEVMRVPLRNPTSLWFYVSASLVHSLANTLNALRKGKNDFATEMKVSLSYAGVSLVGTLLAVYFWGATTLLVGQVRLLSRVISLVLAVVIFFRKLSGSNFGSHSWRPRLGVVKELFVVGFPFALQAILGTAYFQLDILVLGALKTATDVGYYQAPMQVVSAIMLLPSAVIQAYYPPLAKRLSNLDAAGMSLVKQMIGVLAMLGFCLTATFGLGASFLVILLYGAKMQPSIAVMRILSLVFIVRSVAGGLGIGLISVGWQRAQVFAGFVAVVGSLVLNSLLIPTGGFVSVAWVNLITNLVVLCIYALWWKKASARLVGVHGTGSECK